MFSHHVSASVVRLPLNQRLSGTASSCTQFTLALLILAGVVIESSLSQLHTLARSKPIPLGVLRSGVISTEEE